MTLFDKIPTVLTVAVLVGIFAGLKRHSHSARLRLWQIAWFLVFTHFVAQMFEPARGAVSPLLLAIDLAALQASAVVFVVSVSAIVEDRLKRYSLLLVIGIPTITYCLLACYDVHARWAYVASLLTALGGGLSSMFWIRKRPSIYVFA